MDDRIDSMRVGGFVMLALAASELIEKFVLSLWLELDKSAGGTAGAALFDVLLGVAMLQGSDVARKVVLWITGLSGAVLALLLAALYLVGFGQLWPMLATSLVMLLGVFVLNASTEHRRGVVIGSLTLILVGWVGSLVASVNLAGSVDLATVQMLRQWSSPQRSFEDAEAGLAVKVPARWVVLKEGNPIAGGDKPLLTLANTEILAAAQIRREKRNYSMLDNVEFFLDDIAKTKGAEEKDFKSIGRSDTRIGAVPSRRMKVSWTKDGEQWHASFSTWQDGEIFYTLFVTMPRVITKRLDDEVETLERSITFSAPWTTFLREAAASTRKACPLLSDSVILALARAIPRDSPPEAYCREAYRLAFGGQARMDALSSERLREGMKAFFAALPIANRERFGAYVERLRAGQATLPKDDKEMTQATQLAIESLAPGIQEDLRKHFSMAVEMGRLVGVR